ncbi:MAG: PIG-L family deacetylase [Bryobacteraceae bacterium]
MSARRAVPALALLGVLASALWAANNHKSQRALASANANAMPIDLDRGAAGLSRWLAAIRTRASILLLTAHPDDEDGGMLAYESRGAGARTILLTLTRGEGGQNAMSGDLYDALGLIRTEELLKADRYYGVHQYWSNVIDYGFSKTREEALHKWGHERVLADAVRVVRMTRPLVVASVFIGGPTDGHGNHQVAGELAQEVYVAAGDPNRFPEQIREGLRPWKPLKVYNRVPFFRATKKGTIYDYATGKYVPLRFFDYITKTWIHHTPSTTITIPEGTLDPAVGLTYGQMAGEGWGFQKSQNGGGTLPQPSFRSTPYHRFGSRVTAPAKEKSFFDGIDVSLMGIAKLAGGDPAFLESGLRRISDLANQAAAEYKPGKPAAIAPVLADGLKAVRSLLKQVRASHLAEPGKSNTAFELGVKENQFEHALVLALGLSFDPAVAPAHPPHGFFHREGSTFTAAIPGQSFAVDVHMIDPGPEATDIRKVEVIPSDGKAWQIRRKGASPSVLAAGKEMRVKFAVSAPKDAALTKPYFSRPNLEQPYYNLDEPQYRNLSFGPYPLIARVEASYHGADFTLMKVVQTRHHVDGVGTEEQPLYMAPAISVWLSAKAGAVPLDAKSFQLSCTLRSNVMGTAKGSLHLQLPQAWQSAPGKYPFSFSHDGDTQTIAFTVTPHNIAQQHYPIKATAEYSGKTYTQGYRLAGYPGLRPYPYYRPASYEAVGVNVKTAPGLRVGYFPGTGDDLPRALQDLGVSPTILSAGDLASGDLSGYDAIVLGVRAYAVRPELPAVNSRLLQYVHNGGVLIVQYNLQNFNRNYGPYPFTLGSNPQKVVEETAAVKILQPENPVFAWPNKINTADFQGWQEERGHGFLEKWDPRYQALLETHDPGQAPQRGGLLLAHYGRGFYVYDAYALYRQLPAGVPGAYRILANLISMGKNPGRK